MDGGEVALVVTGPQAGSLLCHQLLILDKGREISDNLARLPMKGLAQQAANERHLLQLAELLPLPHAGSEGYPKGRRPQGAGGKRHKMAAEVEGEQRWEGACAGGPQFVTSQRQPGQHWWGPEGGGCAETGLSIPAGVQGLRGKGKGPHWELEQAEVMSCQTLPTPSQ